ncbi:MAG TPA: DNA-protecting protein DprA [Flavobacterium sp.]|nr:DNA-protecting protein DprA [Flavobacterium sp.]
MDELVYKIGISLIPGVGSVNAKKIIAYVGSIEGVFKEKERNLVKIPGIGQYIAHSVAHHNVLGRAEKELAFISRHQVKPLFYLDKEYPERLKHCADAPVMLFVKGDIDFNLPKFVAIVGTRSATSYGKQFCETLIRELNERNHKAIIVSGLAYGIDITAHKAALKYNMPTIAALGHGLSTVYPSTHKSIACEIVSQGALVSEFLHDEPADKANFLKRNRIIAGLCDAVIVAESGEKGGSLVTADIANSYNREVFALPGLINDPYSKGCNKLIKNNKAALIEGVSDLEYLLNWEVPGERKKIQAVQKSLFLEINDEEQLILDAFSEEKALHIDQLCGLLQQPVSKISPLLLNLEFSGLIKSLPGSLYQRI